MGVVYKAEDTRLHRFVALKFQPQEFPKTPQAMARFQREAEFGNAETALRMVKAANTLNNSRNVRMWAGFVLVRSGKADQALTMADSLSQEAPEDTILGDLQEFERLTRIFLPFWKNADVNIPVVKQAQSEYAKLR